MILLLSSCVPALPQNLIQNGLMADTNRDNMADNWEKGYFVTAYEIRNGQYLESHATYCPQVTIYQEMNLTGTQGKKFILSFDLSNSTEIWVRFYYAENFWQTTVQAGENIRHTVEYFCNFQKITRILFSSPANHWSWLEINNVVLIDAIPVGIETVTDRNGLKPEYHNLPGLSKECYIKNRKLHFKN